MKKNIKNNLFGFILGILLCGGIVYGVNIYESNDIEYSPTDASWEVNNVNEAINSLHNMVTELEKIKSLGDATADDIIKGKTAVVNGKLITGTGVETTKKVFSVMLNPDVETTTLGRKVYSAVESLRGVGEKGGSDSNIVEVPFFKEINGNMCMLSSISFSMQAGHRANTYTDSASSSASYNIYLPDNTSLSSKILYGTDNITVGVASTTINFSVFDYDVGEFDKLYIQSSTSVYCYGGNGNNDSMANASANVSEITVKYIIIE